MRIWFFLGLFIFLCWGKSDGEERYYVTFSTTKARPLALGGAFVAVEDDLASINYNPATFCLYQSEKNFRLTLYLNPVAPAVALGQYRSFRKDEELTRETLLLCLGLLIKSITITVRFLDIGLLFGDESLRNFNQVRGEKFFDPKGFLNNNFSTLLFRLRLHPRVQIGATESLYLGEIGRERRWGLGSSYGILVKSSNRLNIGVVYIDLPQEFPDFRTTLERIDDETVNVGFCYKLGRGAIFTCDIRNITEESKQTPLEVHLGIEKSFFSQIALRGGYFKKKDSKQETFSLGMGLVNCNSFVSESNWFSHPDYLLNYSLVLEREGGRFREWHFLSFIFRI